MRNGEESVYPAVAFRFEGLIVVGFQYADSMLPDKPADTWVISGTNAHLPRDVPLAADWQELVRAYGAAVGESNPQFGVTVMFCVMPHMFFTLDADPSAVAPTLTADLSNVPATARIVELLLISDRPSGWNCPPSGDSG